jgi:hypothetical protein
MTTRRGLRGCSTVLMPASALLYGKQLAQRMVPGTDLVVIVPTKPGRLGNVILSVAAGARKRGWKVRVIRWATGT